MLTSLAIKNYALIEDIRVDFDTGLTIITGETGAGKSILLGALALLLGKRADMGSVKDASKKCVVEGHFQIGKYAMEALFDESELDYDNHTIIRREILPSGKSRAFVNDTPVALAQLQAIAPYLVDVHSQHETLDIVSQDFQMEVIDALADNLDRLKLYQSHHDDYKENREALEVLKQKRIDATKELDYNRFLFNELQQANLETLDQTELEETYETLNNAEAIQDAFSQTIKLLEEESVGSLETVKEARTVLGRIKKFSSVYESLWERLNSAIIELEDIGQEIRYTAEGVAADPQLLTQVNEKLQNLYKLQHKHGLETVAELIELRDELDEKVSTTIGLDTKIEQLEERGKTLFEAVLRASEDLHKRRERAIPELKKQLEEILKPLGLPNAQFQFNLSRSKEFKKNGSDLLELLFTANKGTVPGPLKKVASGGEMSRIMLAIKSVLAKYKKLPTIVFDEIDTGVSGEIAKKMADIMFQMSRDMQVLTITHLPQIAAKGDCHFKVYKEDIEQVTVTHLKYLNRDERIVEIAQMLGGKKISEAAMANAKELLN